MSTGKQFQPGRTCLGCRERHPQVQLIRLRYLRGRVVVVRPRDVATGRSVYLCPREDCWRRALRGTRLTFKASKYDRRVVHLSSRELDDLLLRLRKCTREQGVSN